MLKRQFSITNIIIRPAITNETNKYEPCVQAYIPRVARVVSKRKYNQHVYISTIQNNSKITETIVSPLAH